MRYRRSWYLLIVTIILLIIIYCLSFPFLLSDLKFLTSGFPDPFVYLCEFDFLCDGAKGCVGSCVNWVLCDEAKVELLAVLAGYVEK